jgi:hypothetical protein
MKFGKNIKIYCIDRFLESNIAKNRCYFLWYTESAEIQDDLKKKQIYDPLKNYITVASYGSES